MIRAASGCRGMGMPPGLSLLETRSRPALNRTSYNAYVIAITPLPEAAKLSFLQLKLQPARPRGHFGQLWHAAVLSADLVPLGRRRQRSA